MAYVEMTLTRTTTSLARLGSELSSTGSEYTIVSASVDVDQSENHLYVGIAPEEKDLNSSLEEASESDYSPSETAGNSSSAPDEDTSCYMSESVLLDCMHMRAIVDGCALPLLVFE